MSLNISVVIPLWNGEKYIQRSVESVLKQTYPHFEIVVVNDGSTDGGPDLVKGFKDERVRLIDQINAGVSAARNKGIMESQYDYIAFLDADDEWKPEHLDTLAALIDKYPSCGLFSTSYYLQKENQSPTLPQISFSSFTGEDGILTDYYGMASGINGPIHVDTMAVRRSVIEKVGGFPLNMKSGEDIITIAKLYAICDFAYSRKPTAVYYLISTGKNERPILKDNPLDWEFDKLIQMAAHRQNVKAFVSFWHKQRMVNAIYARKYDIAWLQFCWAVKVHPFQTKVYSSLCLAFFSRMTGIDIYTINKFLRKIR